MHYWKVNVETGHQVSMDITFYGTFHLCVPEWYTHNNNTDAEEQCSLVLFH